MDDVMFMTMMTLLGGTFLVYSSIALAVIMVFGINRGRAFTKTMCFWSLIWFLVGVASTLYLTQ